MDVQIGFYVGFLVGFGMWLLATAVGIWSTRSTKRNYVEAKYWADQRWQLADQTKLVYERLRDDYQERERQWIADHSSRP